MANETISGSSAWTAGIILQVNHAWPNTFGKLSMAPKVTIYDHHNFFICFPIVSSKTRTSSTCPRKLGGAKRPGRDGRFQVIDDETNLANLHRSNPSSSLNKLMASQPACSPHPQWQYKDLAKPGHQSHESKSVSHWIYHLGTHTCLAPNELVAQEAWY